MEKIMSLMKQFGKQGEKEVNNWIREAKRIELLQALNYLTSLQAISTYDVLELRVFISNIKRLLNRYKIKSKKVLFYQVIKGKYITGYVNGAYKLKKVLKNRIGSKLKTFFKIFTVAFISSSIIESKNQKINAKILLFRRKLRNMIDLLKQMHRQALKFYFFSLFYKINSIRLKRKKNTEIEKKIFLKMFIVQMIKKCKINTGQKA